ncbi:MAG TPA: hypothetical protein DIT01_19190 [Lentisphaeria bacterium]|nr:hypothetical protein [Lentisphaeria bacterium]
MGSINFPVQRLLPVALLAAVAIASAQYVDDFDTEALFARKLIEKRMYDFAERQLNFVSSNFKSEQDQINILYGRYYGARGKRSKAVEYLKKVPSSSAHYSGACLARALVASKPEDKAAGFAAYLASLGPPPLKNTKHSDEFTNAMIRYAEALKRLNQPAKAEEIIKLIPKYLPKSGFDDRMAEFLGLQAKLAAVDILVDKKRPSSQYEADVNAALKTIEGMMWHEPDLITALVYTEFGHACVLLNQPDKAIKTLNGVAGDLDNIEKALKKQYGNICGSPLAPAYYYLGEALMAKGRTARDSGNKGDAQRHLLRALQQYYKCAKRYKCAPIYDKASQKVLLVKDILVDKFGVNHDKLNAKFPPTNEQAVKIAAGHAEYRLQQYSRALPHYLEGARLSLRSRQAAEAFLFAAICYYKTDHYLEAAACADFMAERYPKNRYTWDALFNVATILRVRSNEFRQANLALSDRYNGYSALLMGRFVKLAPDHPKAPTAANTTAESQYARGSRLSKEKKILVQSGKAPEEIRAHVLKMRKEYLAAVPLYEVLTEEYGGTKEGIKALYRLGWIYHIDDDSENAYTYFLRYCEVQQEPVREKYESKFLAARRLMLLDKIDDAMEHFEGFLAWTKPGTAYHRTEHLGTYRENAIGFVAWCYDIKAQKIRKEIIALNQKLLTAPSELPEDGQVDEGASDDGEGGDAAEGEGGDDGGDQVEAVVDKPLTAAAIAARIEELQAQFDAYKARATREFIDFVNRYPDSGQTPANLAKIASLHVEQKDFTNAETWLIRLNAEYPKSNAAVQARFTLGRVYIENNNYPKASETFSKMLDRLPSYPLANLVYVGSRMYIDGDPARPGLTPEIILAANHEIVARAENPEHPDRDRALKHRNRAMFRVATCLLATEQFEEAIELFERMMRESQAAKESGGKESAYYFEILHGRGIAFRHAGRLEESSASFDKLLSEINRDRYPGQYYASLVGAGISMAGGDNEETVRRSVARFMQVIQFADADSPRIRPSVEDAYIEVARALASLGDQERAIGYKREYLAKFHDGRYRKAFNSLPPKRF